MKYILILILLFNALSGCTRQIDLNEEEITYLWNMYHSKAFYEGFYGQLSSKQRREILLEIANESGLEYQVIANSLKEDSPDKFTKLFD
jgi:hypothetical protein